MTTATNFMNERLLGQEVLRITDAEVERMWLLSIAVAAAVAAAAVAAVLVDCLSIGALFCQWVAQKCCSISMHNAAAAATAARQQLLDEGGSCSLARSRTN